MITLSPSPLRLSTSRLGRKDPTALTELGPLLEGFVVGEPSATRLAVPAGNNATYSTAVNSPSPPEGTSGWS
jgi:hypothetical protein